MPEHEIDFANGHLFCMKSQEVDENDLFKTLDVFDKMKKYYNSYCVVTHWVHYTMKNGGFVKSRMKVRDAIWQIKAHWLEQATFEIEE